MEWLLADDGPFARRHAIPEALARRSDLLARHGALGLAEDLVRRVHRSLLGQDAPATPFPTLLFYAC